MALDDHSSSAGRGTAMDRTRVAKCRMSERPNDNYVPGTPAERMALVWELTREVASLSGLDPDAPMRRDVVKVFRRGEERG